MLFRRYDVSVMNFNMPKNVMKKFRARAKEDRITATHMIFALVYAYVCGDIYVVGRPTHMRLGRLFHYRQDEVPNDVLGIKLASKQYDTIINPTQVSLFDENYVEYDLDTSHIAPYRFVKDQEK